MPLPTRPRPVPAGQATPAIDVRNLTKTYGGKPALRGLSLAIAPGSTVALIGPNGAGKSTFVEILMGLRTPDAGQVSVLGHDVVRDPRGHVARIGVQLQESNLFKLLTVREYLAFFAKLYPRHADVQALAREFSLVDFLDTRVGKLSGGQKQRVALALALINDPELVILDEPTVGLDPIVRREFWELIRRQAGRGRTVLFTTHYMDEAKELADQVLMISAGRLVAAGSPTQLIERAPAGVSTLDDAYAHYVRCEALEAA
ncbi:ABC transporter ATP-binding protein [Pseudorhodoferax sp.]|uniref:ABC transporter ATP-binding protein n=1 Tax=Pseudorhodoferax sp. TaxID=1993553 RepID=UPI002DD6B591|nr:ABC transporter ATP-binding protein [Pseudorhodoferax sp.]